MSRRVEVSTREASDPPNEHPKPATKVSGAQANTARCNIARADFRFGSQAALGRLASTWAAHLREADIAALRAKVSNGPQAD